MGFLQRHLKREKDPRLRAVYRLRPLRKRALIKKVSIRSMELFSKALTTAN